MRHISLHIKLSILASIALAFALHIFIPVGYSVQLSLLHTTSYVKRFEKENATIQELSFTITEYEKLEKPDKHEIKVGDMYYDVVSVSVDDNKVYCKVYKDHEESGLVRLLSKHHHNNKSPNRNRRISFWGPVSNLSYPINLRFGETYHNNNKFFLLNNTRHLSGFTMPNLIPPEA